MLIILPFVIAAVLVWALLWMRHWGLARFAPWVLVCGTFLGPPFYSYDGPMQVSLDRVMWLGLTGAFAIGLILRAESLRAFTRLDGLLLAWCGWVLITGIAHGEAPTGISPLARWIVYFLFPLGLYAVLKNVVWQSATWRYFSNLLIGIGVYLALIALLETRGWHGLVFPRFIVDPKYAEFFGRGRGPLLNPVGTGMLINLALAACLIAWPRRSRVGKWLTAISSLVMLAGLYSTLTRSVWMGTAALFGLLLWIYAPRRMRVLGSAAAIVALLGLLTGLGDSLLALKRDKHLTASAAADSVKLRPILATVAWKMFCDHPLLGVGYGHYLNHNRAYLADRDVDLPLEKAKPYIQHNVFLAQLVDCGLIGLAMMGILLIAWTLLGIQLARDGSAEPERREIGVALLAFLFAYVINGMFHDVSLIEMVHMFLFAMVGISVNATLGNLDRNMLESRR